MLKAIRAALIVGGVTYAALAISQPAPQAPQAIQNAAPTLQQAIDQRLRVQVGDLIVNNVVLGAQIEMLQARIAELEKAKPKE